MNCSPTYLRLRQKGSLGSESGAREFTYARILGRCSLHLSGHVRMFCFSLTPPIATTSGILQEFSSAGGETLQCVTILNEKLHYGPRRDAYRWHNERVPWAYSSRRISSVLSSLTLEDRRTVMYLFLLKHGHVTATPCVRVGRQVTARV